MLNLELITIYHITDTSTGEFICSYYNATVYQKNAQKQEDGGFVIDNLYKIRIPTKTDINISIDDYIVWGKGDKTKIPYEKHKIISVINNRRGTHPHIRIEAV